MRKADRESETRDRIATGTWEQALKLSELADHFEKLDELTSRNAMIDALAELFRAELRS